MSLKSTCLLTCSGSFDLQVCEELDTMHSASDFYAQFYNHVESCFDLHDVLRKNLVCLE